MLHKYIVTADIAKLVCINICLILANRFCLVLSQIGKIESRISEKVEVLFKQDKLYSMRMDHDVPIQRQYQSRFAKLLSGNFDVEDAKLSGRLVETDAGKIKALIDANSRITTRRIVERINVSNWTIHGHVKRLGLISNLDI